MDSSKLTSNHADHDHPYEVSDEQLIASAKLGNRQAFNVLYVRHSQRIRRVAYRITRSQGDGEDALQKTYLKAFLHLNSYERRSSVYLGSRGSPSIRRSCICEGRAGAKSHSIRYRTKQTSGLGDVGTTRKHRRSCL
jgi:hypothetical protein